MLNVLGILLKHFSCIDVIVATLLNLAHHFRPQLECGSCAWTHDTAPLLFHLQFPTCYGGEGYVSNAPQHQRHINTNLMHI